MLEKVEAAIKAAVHTGRLNQREEEFIKYLSIVQEQFRAYPSLHAFGAHYLEIGVQRGGSLMCTVAALDEVTNSKYHNIFIGIDPDISKIPGNMLIEVQDIYEVSCQIIKGRSQSLEILAQLERAMAASLISTFSLTFIDGDHSYEAALADLKFAASKVRQFGLIALHDIKSSPSNPQNAGEVHLLWEYLKSPGALDALGLEMMAEIIQEPDQEGAGIGILVKR